MQRSLIVIACLIFAASAQTQSSNQRWYQIEVIIFKQNSKQNELWKTNIDLDFPENLIAFEDSEQLIIFSNQLTAEASKINKDPNQKILWHNTWLQKLQVYKENDWLFINGGVLNKGRRELEGSIKVTRSRYLHLHLDIWLNQFTAAQAHNIKLPSLPKLPTFSDQIDCPAYNNMPIWLRVQLYQLNFDSVFADNKQLWQRALGSSLIDPIDYRLQQLATNWYLQPPTKIQSKCALAYAGDEIIDNFKDEEGEAAEHNQSNYANYFSDGEISKKRQQYQPLVLNAKQKTTNYLNRLKNQQAVAPEIADNLQKIIAGDSDAVHQGASIESIYPLTVKQKVLLNSIYYIDHPKLGVLIHISRPKQ